MKTLKSIFAIALLLVAFSSCGDSDCKNCEVYGDFVGELCGDQLKAAEATDGYKCKKN